MSDLASLKKQRSTIKCKLTNVVKFINAATDKTDIEAIRTRLCRVESLMNEFTNVESKIFDVDPEEESDYEFEEKYYLAKTSLNSVIRRHTMIPGNDFQGIDMTLNASHGGQAEVKLPKISIPHFSGDYTEWQSFYDLFSTTIHDSSILSPVQKMQYLKGSLKGEAATLLRHISVTEANYLEALNKLKDRYDRKKHIINAFIRSFVEHPPLNTVNPAKMKNLRDVADEVVRGLKALGPIAESRDPWLIYWLVTKLDDKSKCMWAENSAEMENPTLEDFFKFLQIRIDSLESLSSSLKSINPKATVKGHVVANEPVINTCTYCKSNNHSLFNCSQFNHLDVNQRREWVRNGCRCFNCLSSRHAIFRCLSKRRCQICSGKHHTLLHEKILEHKNLDDKDASTSKAEPPTLGPNLLTINSAPTYCAKVQQLQSILPTALITILDFNGKQQICRALLDSGSQASFITESCVQRLNLKRFNSRIPVSGLGCTKAGTTRGRVTIVVHPRCHPNFEINALVLSKLTSDIPSQAITSISADIRGNQLSDPHFNKPGVIDLLIGADHFFSILLDGKKQLNQDGLMLQNTVFGWIVSGRYAREQEFNTSSLVTNYLEPEADIDTTLKRFWKIESIGEERHFLSTEEEFCEKHFKENFKRGSNGKFVVSLPFKQPPVGLSNTLNLAIQRLRSMERLFQRDPQFKSLYHNFMNEYEELNHMEKIKESEITSDGYYLPHHGVLRKESSTTKLRVVFDGSAKSCTGRSLNSYLAVGPTIQSNLYSIILRFREHKIAISADIEKMYRQVWINPNDAKFQMIVWRKQPSDPIAYYRLSTVTYGLSSAPFLAIRCLKQIVEEHKDTSPTACHEIKNNIYVDDLMTAVDTIPEGLQLKEDISNILVQYGFQLRKWSSNCPQILSLIPNKEDITIYNIKELDDAQAETIPYQKVLGISWDPHTDNFMFKASLQTNTNITKRVILSEASRLFDPLGWLTPAIVKIKIFMQKLWILNLNWDDSLPEEQKKQWQRIRSNLHEVEHITIPRFIHSSSHSSVDIHGFCDASESAYAAVIYFKITNPEGVFVQLVSAKSKVAPIKQVSLPRLELCGAVLLSKLIETVKNETSLKINNIFSWTDSKIVLDWLASEPRRWTTFVANRTSAIIEIIPRNHWRHVPSSQNPADCASRGMFALELRQHELWWNGPEWLKENKEHWPEQNFSCVEVPEERLKISSMVSFSTNEWFDKVFKKYSSYFKLQRIIALLYRFVHNIRVKKGHTALNPRTGIYITKEELFNSSRLICKYEQQKYYHNEILDLNKKRNIKGSSTLISLNPFLDQFQILRVGGRIQNSEVPYSTKHPIIMSPKSIITKLILDDLHLHYNHAGPSLLLSLFRQTYWMTSARAKVRETTNKCVTCIKYKANVQSQIMGNLPKCRVELVRPFLKTGLDFAGPLLVKLAKGRGQRTYKSYLCVFVCLSTKGIHLELVGDLTSESFLGALKRFIARRGICSEIHSDNGTNFVGASNQIQNTFQKLLKNSTSISSFCSKKTISWNFIPPNAPHFGGIWEAAVKSAKYHLKRVIGNTILTQEELNTLVIEIESILNSRPICMLSDDQIDPLTPAHFLIGHPLTKIPETDVTNIKINYLTRWQMVQQLQQHFWKRWQIEYLTSLQQRTKWQQPQNSIKINDVVVIKDKMPPNHWLLGRVVKLHPAPDGIVRVVTLKTKSGELKRPIHKLCLLPVYNTDEIDIMKPNHSETIH